MMQIYCVKCREYTDSKSEKYVTSSNGCPRLTAICKVCGTKKGVFTNENKGFQRKNKDELDEARSVRQECSLKKKALAIGYKALLDKDTKKCVKACFPRK